MMKGFSNNDKATSISKQRYLGPKPPALVGENGTEYLKTWKYTLFRLKSHLYFMYSNELTREPSIVIQNFFFKLIFRPHADLIVRILVEKSQPKRILLS